MGLKQLIKFGLFSALFINKYLANSQNIDIERANAYYKTGSYYEALKHYQFAHKRKTSSLILERIADCHFKLGEFKKSEGILLTLKKKYNLNENQAIKYVYLLKHNGKIKDARAYLVKLHESSPPEKKTFYLNKIAACDSIQKWKLEKTSYLALNMKALNSVYSDISPVNYGDSIVFASNREDWRIKPRCDYDNQPFFDLYITKVDYQWKTGKARLLSSEINSKYHESSATFTEDGKRIYFTKCSEKEYENDSVKRMKLYSSEKIEGLWTKPKEYKYNDSTYSFAHPSVDPTNKMVFFASDMKGGYGGTDIYVSIQVKENYWTDPINLGPVINTPGNESYPFYHPDGSLYFSSDFHTGFGGYDLFVAKQKDGDWVSVTNLKQPFNSTYDDFGIFFNEDKSFGFFSSNRPGGKGKEDIYLVRKK